jgi:Fe-S-cluster containining protein
MNCCSSFTLNFSPDYLKEVYDRKIAQKDEKCIEFKTIEEIEIVYPLLVCLGKNDFKVTGMIGDFLYTCKMLDEKTGRCKDYENRPSMCKNFPHYERVVGFEPCNRAFYEECDSVWCEYHRSSEKSVAWFKEKEENDNIKF